MSAGSRSLASHGGESGLATASAPSPGPYASAETPRAAALTPPSLPTKPSPCTLRIEGLSESPEGTKLLQLSVTAGSAVFIEDHSKFTIDSAIVTVSVVDSLWTTGL